jgi:hypothetical protein
MTNSRDKRTGVIGVTWFRREDYPTLLGIFEDAQELPTAWEEWETEAKKVEERLKIEGFRVERAYLDADAFSEWCRNEGVSMNGKARSRFTATTVAKKHRRRQ